MSSNSSIGDFSTFWRYSTSVTAPSSRSQCAFFTWASSPRFSTALMNSRRSFWKVAPLPDIIASVGRMLMLLYGSTIIAHTRGGHRDYPYQNDEAVAGDARRARRPPLGVRDGAGEAGRHTQLPGP